MSNETNIEAQKRWGEAVVSGNLDALDDLVTPSVVDHDPAPDQGPGAAGFKTFFKGLRAAFPDLKISVEHLVAADDNVALAYTLEGTQQGPFAGIAPTGRHVKARGMQIGRFENGKLAERWGSSDELGILKQLGAQIGAETAKT